MQDGEATFTPIQTLDPNAPKLNWYKDNKYCDYHRTNGHLTSRCIGLKHYIQDLIECGDIEIFGKIGTNNSNLKMYKQPFLDHNQDKGSSIPYGYINCLNGFDNTIGCIEPVDTHVNVITI